MSKIILIGGTPRSGKTTLAQKISKKVGIPWVSTDALESIASQYVPEKEKDALFPKSVLRRNTNYGNDELYDTYSTEDIVSAYREQAETVHKAIETLVEYSKKEDWDYIIEGYHVTPKLLSELKNKEVNFSSLILINTEAEKTIKRSRESGAKSDWVRDKTQNEDTFLKIAEMINLFSGELQKEAEKFNVDVLDMSEDFQERFNEAFESLIK